MQCYPADLGFEDQPRGTEVEVARGGTIGHRDRQDKGAGARPKAEPPREAVQPIGSSSGDTTNQMSPRPWPFVSPGAASLAK